MKKTVSLVLVLSMIAVAVIGFGTAANAQTLSNAEKALALINTFATGDADMARSLLAEDSFSIIWLTAPARMRLSVPWNTSLPRR